MEPRPTPKRLPDQVRGAIGCDQLLPGQGASLGDEAAKLLVVFGAVGHEGELVGGKKADEAARGRVTLWHLGPAIVGEDALDRVLAEGGVEAALLFEGKQGKALHDSTGEDAGAGAAGVAVLIVRPHSKQP